MKILFFYRPEIVAFASGALVMIFEILGSRIVSPYIGASLYTWTSLIAIILGALSLGYYYGGKIADKKSDLKIVSYIFLLSAFSVLFIILFQEYILTRISTSITDIRISAICISLILFAPTSFLLGLFQPIVTKIRMTDLESGGRVVGKLSSIGTIGSIVGTLGAGFFLIPFFGVSNLLITLGISCVLLSILCNFRHFIFLQVFLLSGFFISYLVNISSVAQQEENGSYSFDTPYSHVTISERPNERIRDLYIDDITHAGMDLDSNALVYEYTKYYHLFDAFVPKAENILMLGGAAYSFPKSFLESYPTKKLDVVEIDKELTALAKRFFRLPENPRLGIYHQDARTFLNSHDKKYDAILGDAFGSYYSIPYQLTTLEVVQKKFHMLSDNGAVLLNLIGSMQGKNAQFIQSEYLTYKAIFPEVFIIPVRNSNPKEIQNIMLVALKDPESFPTSGATPDFAHYLSKKTYLDIPKDTKILTDNFAPVDYMVSQMDLN